MQQKPRVISKKSTIACAYYWIMQPVASIILVSAASCKTICGVELQTILSHFGHALLVPHVLIKYAHMLICNARARVPNTLMSRAFRVTPIPLT